MKAEDICFVFLVVSLSRKLACPFDSSYFQSRQLFPIILKLSLIQSFALSKENIQIKILLLNQVILPMFVVGVDLSTCSFEKFSLVLIGCGCISLATEILDLVFLIANVSNWKV